MTGRQQGIVERADELAAVRSLIEAAGAGSGGFAVVEGVAGIGKTTLLAAATEIASESGIKILSARGSSLERPIPYGVVRQLLEREVLGAGRERAEELLSGLAGPAAAALGVAEPGTAQFGVDPEFEILSGLYWLCVRLAEAGPLLLVVDDIQWADAQSQRAGAYLARRLADQPISMLAGLRTGENEGVELELGELPGKRISPSPLSATGAARVLSGAFSGAEVPEELVDSCLRATGGNPFFLVELAFDLAEAAASPGDVVAASVGESGPPAVRRSMLMRLGRLGSAASGFARALATLGGEGSLSLVREIAELDAPAAASALDRLSSAEIVVPGPVPRIAHPLIRAAVAAEIPASEEASIHRRAYVALAAAGHSVDRLLPHALGCPPTGDQAIVDLLAAAAEAALSVGAPVEAVRYLERALAEPPGSGQSGEGDEVSRKDVIAALGRARVRSGDFAGGLEALDEIAAAVPADGPLAASVNQERAFAIAATRGMEEARAFVVDAVERARAVGADENLAMQAEMAQLAWLSGAPHGLDLDRYRRLAGSSPAERTILGILAQEEQSRGADADLAIDYAKRALAGGELIAEEGPEAFSWYLAVYTLLTCEALDEADASIARASDEARRRGSAFASAGVLGTKAALALNRGRPAEAEAYAREASAGEIPPAMAPVNAAFLVLALVDQGRPQDARRALDEGGLSGGPGGPTVLRFAPWARGRLAEHERDIDLVRGAVGPLIEDEAAGMPMRALAWRALLARTLARGGEQHREEAASLADEHVAWAGSWGKPGALGIALRSQALTREGEERVRLLQAAIAALERSSAMVEEARARLDLGMTLARAGRGDDAREALRAAFEIAGDSGARDVAKLAAAELEVGKGSRMRLRFDELTPAERRVAEMAAAGSTNRDIAGELFLSPKTVENHLTRVYAKLGVSSRRDLSDVDLAGSS